MPFQFGVHQVTTNQGGKKPNDITINFDGTQFRDLDLFIKLDCTISTDFQAQSFLNNFMSCPNVNFCATIKTPTSQTPFLDTTYTYVNNINSINDTEKALLFCSILRCYVDYVNYPRGNGCKRIFGQILLLLSCKFNRQWHTNIPRDCCAQEIFRLGNMTDQNTINLFNDLYTKWQKNPTL